MQLKTQDDEMNMYSSNNVNEGANITNDFGVYDDLQKDPMNQFDEPYVTPMDDPYVSQSNDSYVSPVKKSKEKGLKDTLLIILGIVMFVGIALWCINGGLQALYFAPVHPMEDIYTNLVEGDIYEGTITCVSAEIGELKHTINFIPAGTEHFYLMVSEDGSTIIPVRASKEWDSLYTGVEWYDVALQERGIVREMDYKVKNELMSDIAAASTAQGIRMEQTYYLDLNANKMGMLQVFAGIAILLCIVYFGFIANRMKNDGGTFSTAVGGVMLVLGFVAAGLIIYLLNMVGF